MRALKGKQNPLLCRPERKLVSYKNADAADVCQLRHLTQKASCDGAMAAPAMAMTLAMATAPPAHPAALPCRSSSSSWLSRTSTDRLPHASRLRRFQIGRFCSVSATSDGAGAAKETAVPNSVVATTPFHLAIPVHDVHAAREFFGGVLGCPEGRSAKTWVDFNLFGHQVVCHEVRNYNASSSANAVDGDPVPVPHFGLAMTVPEFQALAVRVRAAGVKFIIEPHIRFVGQPGEQWTMFFKDSSGNALEFKAMTIPSNLFAKYVVE